MKKIITIMSREAARTVVAELAAMGVHGMTLIEAASHGSLGASRDTVANGVVTATTHTEVSAAADVHETEPRVRLEMVVESHRADEVIEYVEALLDTAEAIEPSSARLVVEDVSAVVHIRSGRILV